MIERFAAFIEQHDLYIITTHDPADADGLGTEMVFACILRERGKQFRIINAGPVPQQFTFMDPEGIIEQWDNEKHGALPECAALLIVDTAEEDNIGCMKEAVLKSREVFIIDHHQPSPNGKGVSFSGIIDPTASSACELAVELAEAAGIALDSRAAWAAYTGIVFDTGSFAYSKTGLRTFKAALKLLELGVNPGMVHHHLCENASTGTLLLQKKAISGMTLHCQDRVAVQLLRREDFAETGAGPNDTDGFVNVPLKSREIAVSIMLKEPPEGGVRCSLRSKGALNVAEIARNFGGGGHINAAGFKSNLDIERALAIVLEKITGYLDKP